MLKKKNQKMMGNKLDALLRGGAKGDKSAPVDIDKAVGSTTHRLLKETIKFTKSPQTFDSMSQYQEARFIILDAEHEQAAVEALRKRGLLKDIIRREKEVKTALRATRGRALPAIGLHHKKNQAKKAAAAKRKPTSKK